jgi:hypothetical protein
VFFFPSTNSRSDGNKSINPGPRNSRMNGVGINRSHIPYFIGPRTEAGNEHRGQASELDESPDRPVVRDIVSAVQDAHELTVALWLTGSWRCNLGEKAVSAEISPSSKRSIWT